MVLHGHQPVVLLALTMLLLLCVVVCAYPPRLLPRHITPACILLLLGLLRLSSPVCGASRGILLARPQIALHPAPRKLLIYIATPIENILIKNSWGYFLQSRSDYEIEIWRGVG